MKMYTEREKVLIKWIMFLPDVENRYSVFFGLINRDVEWLNNIWENDGIKGIQDELLEVLSSELEIFFTKRTNQEVLEGNENE